MARFSMQEFLRLHNIFTHPSTPKPSNRFFSRFYSSLLSSSSFNDEKTIFLLESCQSIKQLFQIQAHLITYGLFFNNPFWSIRILKHSSQFENVDHAILVLKCIDNPSAFCVNSVIKAYSNSFNPDQAVVFYHEMLKSGFVPNSYTFVPLFGCCAKARSIGKGKMCHGLAVKNGLVSVLPLQNSLIHMYSCFGLIEYARKVFDEMTERDLVSWNSLIDGHVRNGNLWVAHELFDIMLERNVVSWNIMIGGYSKGGNPGCSLKLFREMMTNSGMKGNITSMVSVLTACGRSARLKEGKSVHGFITRTLVNSNMILDTSLIDMYSRCQKVEVAKRIFEKMRDRNLVCWNAMILGHCLHGKPEDGLNLFKEMVDHVLPDEITFIGVLCACARAELFFEGKRYFYEMINLYKLRPNFGHFWCMANLYAGAGFIDEAEEMIRNMPEDDEDLSSESLVWANVLSFCRFKGVVDLGERIAKTLIDMDSEDFSYYRLLMNVYALGGRLEDMAKVKMMLKERKIGRTPGCALVDLKELVHDLKVRHFSKVP